MKKFIYLSMALLSLTGLTSCNGNGSCGNGGCVRDKADEVYSGVLPAADAAGIKYTLKLDYDDDKGNNAGDYDLIEAYLVGDSTATLNYTEKNVYKSEGDFTITEKNGNKYIDLTPERKYSSATPMTFMITSDSTLVMTGPDKQLPDSTGLNYTLKKVNVIRR